jgi:hypothetical protein
MGFSQIATAIFGFAVGILFGWIIIRRGRRVNEYDVQAVTWDEHPLPIWRQDNTQTVYILIHSLSVLLIAILFLLDKEVPIEVLGSTRLTRIALWLVWMIAGSVISFLFIYPYVGTMPMAVFQNAFARGQYVGDWSCFSHYQTDEASRTIYLFAARSPEIVRVAWQPTSEKPFEDVLSILSGVLPQKPPEMTVSWYRRPWAVISVLLLLVLPISVGGVIFFLSVVTWSWIYYTIAASMLLVFGSMIIRELELN